MILEDFGQRLVTDLQQSLRDNGVTFGGGGDSKIQPRFNIERTSNGLEFQLLMAEEWYWVDKGRRPGKVSRKGKEALESWGERKGYIGDFINKDLERREKKRAESKRQFSKSLKKLPFDKGKRAFAFVVARTITEKGYKGNDFFEEVIKDGRVKILLEDIKEFIKNGNNSNS